MIHVGDCLEIMRTLDADSVDAVVTDPPYGLKFMGRAWDRGTPGTPFWAEALRVAKPGAYLVAFGGTRTFHRLACAIEDAGWELRDSILRIHEGGARAEVALEDCPWLLGWVFGSGFPKSLNLDGEREGWGTALKPAFEPIVLARKPLEGTVADNVAEYSTGALNIDACRIEAIDERAPVTGRGAMPRSTPEEPRAPGAVSQPNPAGRWPANVMHDGSSQVLAHFPAAPGQKAAISTGNGERKSANVYNNTLKRGRAGEPSANSENEGAVGFKMRPGARRLDEGSAARFFYCPKASREDRNDGCDGMEAKPLLWSSGAQSPGTFQAEGTRRASENNHPTVKPTELMRWLCRLVTPPGGLVLDPFAGSGSTGRAAIAEGFRFVGIELDPGYAAIAEARIRATQPGLALA